jgi:hypothetical protein
LSRTAIAPSTLLWFVTATWVSPRSIAVRMNVSSLRIESRLNRVWMWKSANARFVGGCPVASRSSWSVARSSLADAAIVTSASRMAHQALAELAEVLERHARADGDAS